MDIVFIHGLRVDCIIGIHDWERTRPQPVLLDLEMGTDIRPAAHSEDIALALDYDAISKDLSAFIKASECRLLETLAEQIAQRLQSHFGVPWLRLRLSKPDAVPEARDVGIGIERGVRPGPSSTFVSGVW
jgi:dihydroneopterin aldolase